LSRKAMRRDREEQRRREELPKEQVNEVVTALRAESERQRAETAKRAAEAQQQLSQAAEQAIRESTAKVRTETESLLDELLRDIRAIGEQ
jgi:GTP cyclohydrolase I